MSDSALRDMKIDRGEVERLITGLEEISWGSEGRVALLVETPELHRHQVRQEVDVIQGRGFAGDHAEKSFYRGEYVPGREVSAVALELLDALQVEPSVVGDNLITEGIDLARLRTGDLVRVGDRVLLERSNRAHRPCATFRRRSSPEAFAVVSRNSYRGALFVVREGGRISCGDLVRIGDGGTRSGHDR